MHIFLPKQFTLIDELLYCYIVVTAAFVFQVFLDWMHKEDKNAKGSRND